MDKSNATKVHNASLDDDIGNTDTYRPKGPSRIRLYRLNGAKKHGESIIISAPTMSEIDKMILSCLGIHIDADGHEYVVLGENVYGRLSKIEGSDNMTVREFYEAVPDERKDDIMCVYDECCDTVEAADI